MTKSLSQGTTTSAGEHLHFSQPVCLFLFLNLSSALCLLFYPTQSVTPFLAVWWMKNNGSAGWNKKGHLFEKARKGKHID